MSFCFTVCWSCGWPGLNDKTFSTSRIFFPFICCVVPSALSFSLSLFIFYFSGKSTNLSLSLCQIYCSSSSFFLDSPDVRGVSVESPEFFAGIRVRHSNLTFNLLQRLIWRKDGSFIISVICICMCGSAVAQGYSQRLIIRRLLVRFPLICMS